MMPRRMTLRKLMEKIEGMCGSDSIRFLFISHISGFPMRGELLKEGPKYAFMMEGWEFPLVWKYPQSIEEVARVLQEFGAARWDEETYQKFHPAGREQSVAQG